MTADDQSKISFSIPQGTLPRQPIFVGLSTELMFVTPVDSDAAVRANVWLRPVSS